MSSPYDDYERLTSSERSYIWNHPGQASTIKEDAEKALAEAKKRFNPGSLHNGAGDAFRHCYWNALLARDIGKSDALSFTAAHEDFPGNPAAEKHMDLINNAVGAEIGAANKNFNDQQLADACHAALNADRLVVLNKK